ncbi:hypothetical protein CRX67_09500 [Enterobacteriaceae bacterium A-F18]|nr:hypothetical protein CRX67_09500 [Enterobacteriaceae bacterium A-F18]HEO9916652.1 hypothetical protein [Enterobacter asburiae]
MDEPIAKYRNRIKNAALAWMKKKTGGNLLIINLPGNKIETIEITESFMDSILRRFEGLVRGEFGAVEGNKMISSAYHQSIEINKDTEYLTESGKLIVDDLLMEVVEYVKEKHSSRGVI